MAPISTRFTQTSSAILLCFLALTAGSCGESHGPEPEKPLVLCSIFSYYDAARAIGANTVNVQIILPGGQSPHEYDLSVEDKVKAVKAKLYVRNGMGLDERFDKAFEGSSARILTISKEIPQELILTTTETMLDGKTEAASNPHIWLDPDVQIAAAEKIRDALTALFPANKSVYDLNAKTYITEIQELSLEWRAAVKTFKTKEFIGFHSAYEYLARRYGLKQIASVEELPGSGLSVDQTMRIIKLINDKGIKYVAMETGLSPQGIALIQEKTGVKTITLQPLETYDDAKDTYVSLMRANLESLKTALGQ